MLMMAATIGLGKEGKPAPSGGLTMLRNKRQVAAAGTSQDGWKRRGCGLGEKLFPRKIACSILADGRLGIQERKRSSKLFVVFIKDFP